MSDRGKAPISAATLTGAAEQAALAGASVSAAHSTMQTASRQGLRVAALLQQGEGNAISTAELVRLAGYGSARELQAEIARERRHGALILSRSGGGYFLPSEGEQGKREIAAYIQTLRARALNTLMTLKTARAALAEIDGQVAMDGGGACGSA